MDINRPTMDQFTRFRFLSGLQRAPGGREAVFGVTRIEAREYRHTLWLWEGAGRPKPMTELGSSLLFVWENRGTLLFAASRRPEKETRREREEGVTVFYRMPIDGGEAAEAFRLPLAVEAIRPLTEEAFLVLARQEKTPGRQEGEVQVLDELPFWSNGDGFTSGRRLRLFLYHASQDRLEPVSGEREEVEEFRVGAGGRFAYSVSAYRNIAANAQSLWEYDPAIGASRMLLGDVCSIHDFDYWGEELIVAGAEGAGHGLLENPALYRLQNGKCTLLARPDLDVGGRIQSDCRYGGGITFQVAGDALYFTAVRGHTCSLFRMELPGGSPEPITAAGYQVELFDAAGEAPLLVAFEGQELQELYRLEPQGLRKISAFNQTALEGVWVGRPEHHIARRGGCPVDGWALSPKDLRPDRKYPALLNIHGGPKTAYGDNYFHEMQYWAGQGYFVLFCNPRGSDGKGDEFSDLRGRYGDWDYADLMGFLDEMLERYPAIDSRRIGVAGGSYGGFLVNWIIGRTHRFAAAISQRGISNWTTMDLLSDIGAMFVRDQIGQDPWEGRELLWEKSPLAYARTVKTPTLFLHSDEDYRCPVSESYQMYAALHQQGVECRACIFHGEHHELSRSGRPEHRLRRLQEITRWLDRFCKGQER